MSGRDEARFSGYGVICGMPDANGVIGDLGGGSLELVALARRPTGRVQHAAGRAVAPDVLAARAIRKRTVVDAIESVAGCARKPARPLRGGRRLASFARLHMEQAGYPLHIIHQYEIAAEEARAVARLIAVQSAKSLEKMPECRAGVSTPCRWPVWRSIVCWRALKPKTVVVSAFGLREGFYHVRLSEAEQARHPLIAFAEEQAPAGALRPVAGRDLRLAQSAFADEKPGRPHPAHRRLSPERHLVERPSRLSRRSRPMSGCCTAGAGHEPSRSCRARDGARPIATRAIPSPATMDTALRLSDSKGKAFARRLAPASGWPTTSGGAPGSAAADRAPAHRSRPPADRAGGTEAGVGRCHGPAPADGGRGLRSQVGDRLGIGRPSRPASRDQPGLVAEVPGPCGLRSDRRHRRRTLRAAIP